MIHAQIVIGHLGDYNHEIGIAAKKALLQQGKRAVPHLVTALTNQDQKIVAEVAQLLGFFRKDAISAVSALVAVTYINNPTIRANAIASLSMITERAEICIPVIKRYMKDEDVNVRRNAVVALSAFGKAANDAVKELVDALVDEDCKVREFAAGILCELGDLPLNYIKPIMAGLKDVNPYVRFPIKKLLNRVCNRTGMTLSELESIDDDLAECIEYRASFQNLPIYHMLF